MVTRPEYMPGPRCAEGHASVVLIKEDVNRRRYIEWIGTMELPVYALIHQIERSNEIRGGREEYRQLQISIMKIIQHMITIPGLMTAINSAASRQILAKSRS
ncbi:hypothetical protein AG1IA_07994 [Rhizoctonia solani AG-1 IA]|uniref:Uncharacterized protein n=1 Tax=Thanatephorus cucumeris (strain AG1-IA) TaxID=983506 RepID=L8WID7_THACA|nr:hypothetical protein AG1IA_07994 [Rhizoctonia solani AG-1 IA]